MRKMMATSCGGSEKPKYHVRHPALPLASLPPDWDLRRSRCLPNGREEASNYEFILLADRVNERAAETVRCFAKEYFLILLIRIRNYAKP